MTKHTPGPWVWRKWGNPYWLTADYGKRRIVIATVSQQVGVPQQDFVAVRDPKRDLLVELTPEHPDARLIAAAPDLLAGCQDALVSFGYAARDRSQCIAAIKAAIAKAIPREE
jgi:hypothetical protein